MYDDWFEVDDPDPEVSDKHREFVDTVREFARSWPECPPDATAVLVFPPGEDEDDDRDDLDGEQPAYDSAMDEEIAEGRAVLMLIADVDDRERNLRFRTLGATVAGDRLFCSERHDTTYRPYPSEDVAPLEATGSPEELGRIAAAWFGEVLRRPVIAPRTGPGPTSFVAPGTALPPGHRWVRNGPRPV
ncbi:hypothetical protein [Peterkaempfera sp. SMS 1(5)a]|uniref:hypothetical protein n=1 Tax=Peterkaempfera podocarpi TaxID=3232308 RepID=UPI003671B8A4